MARATTNNAMDIPRADAARQRRRKRILMTAGAVVAIAVVTAGLSRLQPAAPTVDRGTVWVDTVKRGSMLRQVRGLGTLVPEDIRWIPAQTEGRVERILVQPGSAVDSDTVLLELSNAQLQQETLDAELRLRAADAEYRNIQVQLESQVLNQQAELARAQAEFEEARMRAETDQELAKLGVISDLNLKVSQTTAQQRAVRSQIEEKRLSNSHKVLEAQLAARRAEVDQLRALAALRRSQMEALRVRAGTRGVLQELPLQVGQFVTAGTVLARVVQPERLKAELRIPETQAGAVQLGQTAQVDTRNGVVRGRVVRIDPAVQAGTVAVDVALEGELPRGARPDLSVDGTIQLERLEDVIYVGRPAFGQENGTVGMFKIEADGRYAVRTPVKLGRSSVNVIEIVEGLKEGEEVILSDMSRWDSHDRVRLQ